MFSKIALLVLLAASAFGQGISPGGGSGTGGNCGALGGDVTGTCGANTVVKVNGAALPVSAGLVGTDSNGRLISASATLPVYTANVNLTTGAFTCDFAPIGGIIPACKVLATGSVAPFYMLPTLINLPTTATIYFLFATNRLQGVTWTSSSPATWCAVNDTYQACGTTNNFTAHSPFVSTGSGPTLGYTLASAYSLDGGTNLFISRDSGWFQTVDAAHVNTVTLQVYNSVTNGAGVENLLFGSQLLLGQGSYITWATPYHVSTLPACPSTLALGTVLTVDDALNPISNATLTGGGAQQVPVYCNGTAWVAMQGFPTALPNGTTATTQSQGDNSTKVANTTYTDTAIANAIAGVNPAVAVLAASTANVTGTYANGVAGIGATFTVTATGAFMLDGVAINTIGQRILLKDQSSGLQNGMYTATVVGVSLVSPVFTRALDYDTPSDINSTGAIPVQSGTVNTTTSWLLTSTVTTVGTDALTYVRFSIAPTTLVTSSSPGAGIGHFAGGTQVLTSSPVVSSDLNITTTTCTNQFVSAISAGGVGTCTSPSGGSGFSQFGTLSASTPPLAATLTWVNQGSATAADTNGLTMQVPGPGGGASTNFNLLVQALPATPYTFTVGFQVSNIPVNNTLCALVLRESSSGKLVTVTFGFASGWLAALQHYTNPTTFSSTTATGTTALFQWQFAFMRITDNGTNITASYSWDGTNFIDIATEARTAFMTPNQIGFGVSNTGSSNPFRMFIPYWNGI